MTIYLDIVLLENLCMNYIILFATGYIMKIKLKHFRLFLSSLIGSIYAILAYMQILPMYSNLITKIILSITMVYIAFKPKNVKLLLKQLIIFYLTSFAFGGSAFALLYFVKPQQIFVRNGVLTGTYPIKIALLGGILGFAILSIAFKIVKNKMTKKDMVYQLKITIKEKTLITKAILDTGNMLKDPITKTPVIVIEKNKLYEILPREILENTKEILGGDWKEECDYLEYRTKFRIIPFCSIGKQNGMLLGIKADEVIIMDEEENKKNNVIIGIYEQKLTKNNEYSALIGLDLLERGEENEYITNIKI